MSKCWTSQIRKIYVCIEIHRLFLEFVGVYFILLIITYYLFLYVKVNSEMTAYLKK